MSELAWWVVGPLGLALLAWVTAPLRRQWDKELLRGGDEPVRLTPPAIGSLPERRP